MARIKLAPLVTDIAGTVGGLTIQRNKFGMTMRAKPLPLHSASSAQINVRALMAKVQAAWQDLTDAQRLQWNRFLDFSSQTIKHDKNVRLSGHALYLKYQFFRLLTGRSLLTTITYVPMPAVPLFDEFLYSFPTLEVFFDGTVDVSEFFFILKVTSPRLANKAFSRRGLRYVYTVYADWLNYVIQDPYVEAFGALAVNGDTIHYSLQWFSMLAPVYTGITTGKAIVQV